MELPLSPVYYCWKLMMLLSCIEFKPLTNLSAADVDSLGCTLMTLLFNVYNRKEQQFKDSRMLATNRQTVKHELKKKHDSRSIFG